MGVKVQALKPLHLFLLNLLECVQFAEKLFCHTPSPYTNENTKYFLFVQLCLYNTDFSSKSVAVTCCLSLTPSTTLANTQHGHSNFYADVLCQIYACSKLNRAWTDQRIVFSIRIRIVAKKVIVVSLRNTQPGKINGTLTSTSSNMLMFAYFIEVNILHSDVLHHWSFFIYIRCDYSEGNTALPEHPYHWKRKNRQIHLNIGKKIFLLRSNIRPFCDAG